MTTLHEARHPGSCLISEPENYYARDTITIAASQTILSCAVIGKIMPEMGTVTVGAVTQGGSAGGALTKNSTPYGTGVQVGTYRIVCTHTAAGGGTFDVIRPDGDLDGVATEGAAYTGQLHFQIDASGTDYAVGDVITIPVTIADLATAGEWGALDVNATTGMQHAAGIAIYPVVTAGGATAQIAAWTRGPVEVRAADLEWPSGITSPQKLAAIAELAAIGIIVR